MVYTIRLHPEFLKVSCFKNPLLTFSRYYNGSTTIEIQPFSGIAAQEQGSDATWCPNLKGKTFDIKHDTILALTEQQIQYWQQSPERFSDLVGCGFQF
jgi:hypothetical protein